MPAKASLDWLVARPIAHRGLHDKAKGIIENTATAALAAVDAGFAIECDVQLTEDGEAVVFHDFTLDRLTEATGRIDARNAASLADIAMRGTADRIMRLGNWLGAIAGRTPVVIEIKSAFTGDTKLTGRVVELVGAYSGPFALKSFDPLVVKTIREIAPHMPRGIIAMNDYEYEDYAGLSAEEKRALASLLHFGDTKPDFLSWRVRDLPSAAPFLCRSELGLPVMTWTVRTDADRHLARAYADQMVFEGFRP